VSLWFGMFVSVVLCASLFVILLCDICAVCLVRVLCFCMLSKLGMVCMRLYRCVRVRAFGFVVSFHFGMWLCDFHGL